ncbi:MAG: GTP cyclohydrolase II RibA, partial [Chloroflexota bacterium]
MSHFIAADSAIALFEQGARLIVTNPETPHSGFLIKPADFVTPTDVHEMTQVGNGLLYLPLTEKMSDRLGLRLTAQQEISPKETRTGMRITLPVDVKHGVVTGLSAADRAQTIQALIDPHTTADDLVTPGHITAVRTHAGGLFEQRHGAEAGIDLARLAGLTPAVLMAPIFSESGSPATLNDVKAFSNAQHISIVTLQDILFHRMLINDYPHDEDHSPGMRRAAEAPLPTEYGQFEVIVYEDLLHNKEHMIIKMGDLSKPNPLIRIHSECLTGDALGSLKCDCGQQLDLALKRIAEEGRGAVLYLRQEGRGIGLANKMRAYALQAEGLDTVDANTHQGLPADGRTYDMAAAMLHAEGAHAIRLMTNNPE